MMWVNSGTEGLTSRGRSEMGTDLEYARKELQEKGLAFVIVKDEKVLAESDEKGVAPFFRAVDSLRAKGVSVADKIVGKAVAFLCVYAEVASVYTPVVSEPAAGVLRENGVHLEADTTVSMILNKNKDDQCPVEQMIFTCATPEEAYTILREKFEG